VTAGPAAGRGEVTFRGGVCARAAIFDFNGTITLDEHIYCEIFQELLEPLGIPLTAEQYFGELVGLDDATVLERVLAEHGRPTDAETIESFPRRRLDLYLERAAARPPIRPGSRELVLDLAGRFPIGVASGALREEVEFVLDRGGLLGCFETIVTLEDVARAKPDPEAYELALARLNAHGRPQLAPSDVVVFEDSAPGVQAAKAAGMACIAVLGTLGAADADRLGLADLVVGELGAGLVKHWA
jgi:beta-phosphoglucomutase